MKTSDLGKGIGTLGVAAAVAIATYVTGNPFCLLGLLALYFIW